MQALLPVEPALDYFALHILHIEVSSSNNRCSLLQISQQTATFANTFPPDVPTSSPKQVP